MATINNRFRQPAAYPVAPKTHDDTTSGEASVVAHKKVLITSLECGGGHRALLNMLADTMPGASNTSIYTYHSRQKIYDTVYRFMLRFPRIYQKIREHTYFLMKYFGWIQVIFDYQGSKQTVLELQPDLIICANPLQPIIFLQVKKALKLNYDIVMCICDYGDQKAYVDSAPMLHHYLVRDDYTRACTEKYVSSHLISTFGTTVHQDFLVVKNMDSITLESFFKAFCEQYCPTLDTNSSRRKILVIGGSGWVKNSLQLINTMSRSGDYDILVACGKDVRLARKLSGMRNVFAFGFVSQKELATVERSVDAIILSSLAPATMHELFTINQHPLFVHRYIKGQETPHIKLLENWDVGIYEPRDHYMIELIKDYLSCREKYVHMIENGHSIQQDNVERSFHNHRIISEL